MRYRHLRWVQTPVTAAPDLARGAPRPRFAAAAPEAAPPMLAEQPELDYPLSPRDTAIFLLHAAGEVEHALLAQYLYAAYSLGGDQVPEDQRQAVEGWRQMILGIAREEMGHLVTVQNLLRLIGGPLNLEREDYPFRSDVYPFPFTLERLTRRSLARYVVAEMPLMDDLPSNEQEEMKEIIRVATDGGSVPVNRVGALYQWIISLFTRPGEDEQPEEHLQDSDFLTGMTAFQATDDDWGGDGGAVLIPPVTDREQAIAALDAIARQGEGLTQPEGALSHFDRFRAIYRDLEKIQGWSPSRPVPSNPTTGQAAGVEQGVSFISHPAAQPWAHLFNLRYRMLLGYLLHFLLLDEPLYLRVEDHQDPANGDRTARGILLRETFNEMRRLRKIAERLVSQPEWEAGPPFELPYTLSLPDREPDRWRAHRDVLQVAQTLIEKIGARPGTADAAFLDYLRRADATLRAVAEARIAGTPLPQQERRFQKVVLILEEAVRGFRIPGAESGGHGAFWRGLTRDQFKDFEVEVWGTRFKLIHEDPPGSFHGATSNLVKVLLGEAPIDVEGRAVPVGRMPARRPAVPRPRVAFIQGWIEDGCPDNDPPQLPGGGEPDPGPGRREEPTMNRFSTIKQILEDAVSGEEIGPPHRNFWRVLTRDQFVEHKISGRALIAKKPDGTFDPEESNLIKALEARAPFGIDVGTSGASLRRMPAGRDPVAPENIQVIRQWIKDGCPDDGG